MHTSTATGHDGSTGGLARASDLLGSDLLLGFTDAERVDILRVALDLLGACGCPTRPDDNHLNCLRVGGRSYDEMATDIVARVGAAGGRTLVDKLDELIGTVRFTPPRTRRFFRVRWVTATDVDETKRRVRYYATQGFAERFVGKIRDKGGTAELDYGNLTHWRPMPDGTRR